jgi:hypothetical protein
VRSTKTHPPRRPTNLNCGLAKKQQKSWLPIFGNKIGNGDMTDSVENPPSSTLVLWRDSHPASFLFAKLTALPNNSCTWRVFYSAAYLQLRPSLRRFIRLRCLIGGEVVAGAIRYCYGTVGVVGCVLQCHRAASQRERIGQPRGTNAFLKRSYLHTRQRDLIQRLVGVAGVDEIKYHRRNDFSIGGGSE